MSVVAYASFAGADLARALALARALKARHPDWKLCAVWVDGADEAPGWRGAFDHVIEDEALYGADWRSFVFRHEAREAVAAAKGRALLRLLVEGAEKVLYFSPDIAVLHDLGDLAAGLDGASALLTPHLLDAEETPQATADNEGLARRCGVFKPI